MDFKEELREVLGRLAIRIKPLFKDASEKYMAFTEAQNYYLRVKAEYEAVDRKLAMLDGRFSKVGNTVRKDKDTDIVLTKEQILSVMEKLGISITDAEKDEDD
jgi:recombinational DNA repair ATPase RecF